MREEPKLQELKQKQIKTQANERLRQMREMERANANNRAQQYRRQLQQAEGKDFSHAVFYNKWKFCH